MKRVALFPFVLVTLVAAAAPAQPLADSVPKDAVLYVGWAGAEELGPAYENSRLKAFLAASNLPDVLADTLARASAIGAARDPNAAEAGKAMRTLGAALWAHPTAMYIPGPAQAALPDAPPGFVLICQAGADADALTNQLNALREKAPPHERDKTRITNENGTVVLSAALPAGIKPLADAGAALSTSDRFKAALGKTVESPAVVAYADAEAILAWIDRAAAASPDPDAKNWPKGRDALGLNGLKRVVWSAGFDGKEWASRAFVEAPVPRKGLLALLDAAPLSDDALKLVPQGATWFTAGKLDLGRVLDEVRAGATQMDPNAGQQMDNQLRGLSDMLGVNLDATVRGLGDEWIAYSDPAALGTSGLGVVIVNPLKDAALVERSLTRFEEIGNQQIARSSRGGRPGQPALQFRVFDQDGVKIHAISLFFVAPSWAVHDGKLYIGLYPQPVQTAAAIRPKQNGSILDNVKFAEMRKRLDNQKSSAVTFVDLPATAGESYTGLVLLSQLFASFEPPTQWNASEPEEAAPDGVAKLLPPLSVILPHLAPAGGVAWSDNAGYHVRSVTPFPGAQMFGPGASQMSLGQSAMMAGVLLPAIGAARRTATQMEAATNLRQIGVGFHVYAEDHDGAFPKNMAELVTGGYVPPNVVVSPESGTVVPPDFEGWSAEQKTRWVNENGSFVVVPGLDKDTGFEKVAAFQKPEETMGRSVAVLFLDGHIETVPPERARQLIQDQTGKSPEELAEQAGAEEGDDAAPAAPQ